MNAPRFCTTNFRPAKLRSAIFAFAVMLLGLATAQDVEDAEIEALEADYRNQLTEIRDDLGEKWLSALSNLKDNLTREQKFDQALLVRGEEQRVAEMLESEPLPASRIPTVKLLTLLAGDASLSGGLSFAEKNQSISSWSETSARATWDVPADLVPGTYELILHFAAGDEGGGTFKVEIGDDQALSGEILPSKKGGWKRRRALLVGECVLDEHTGKLALISGKPEGRELMVLHSIDLAPPGTWAEMQSPAAGGEPSPDADSPPAEFEKLEGARWVDRESRASGEFVIAHGGDEHIFQLYFVRLPPTTTPTSRFAKAELSRTARLLRTSGDRILRLGERIDEGLRDAVWTEELTIYTRWESRGREGRYLAYILVGDTPMSLTLVDKGHALVGGSFATEVPFMDLKKGSAKAFANRLRSAEKVARKSRRGIWGL